MGTAVIMGKWKLEIGGSDKSHKKLQPPAGFSDSSRDGGGEIMRKGKDASEGKEKMAMETAQGQGRSLLMNIFMMWMAGNSIHIFPIMMVGMALWTPISAMMNMKTAFAKFEGPGVNLILPKLMYAAIHIAGISAGIYKCSNLGLVPNKASDWLVHEGILPATEFSGGGASF